MPTDSNLGSYCTFNPCYYLTMLSNRVTKRYCSAVAIALAIALGGCAEDGAPPPAIRDDENASAVSGGMEATQAEERLPTLEFSIGETTVEDLMVQFPGIQPEIARTGEERSFKWALTDGSVVAAYFEPLGGEGSERGLVLSRLGAEER